MLNNVIMLFILIFSIRYIYSLNTLRLWQPQLFIAIENFNSLNSNINNLTFCEILDISTSVTENATVALKEMSNCEKVRDPY